MGTRRRRICHTTLASAAVTNTPKVSSLTVRLDPGWHSKATVSQLPSHRTGLGDRPPSAVLGVTTQLCARHAGPPRLWTLPPQCCVTSCHVQIKSGAVPTPGSRGHRPTLSRGKGGSVHSLGTDHRGSPPQRQGQKGQAPYLYPSHVELLLDHPQGRVLRLHHAGSVGD